eukprot:GSMAST32.ASY1.ANO1.1952.1 assembled CDS
MEYILMLLLCLVILNVNASQLNSSITSSCLTEVQVWLTNKLNISSSPTKEAVQNIIGVMGNQNQRNTCFGRIFFEKMGDTSVSDNSSNFSNECSMCKDVTASRTLLLELYHAMSQKPKAVCTRPIDGADFNSAHEKDTFLILFFREQLLSVCDLEKKNTKAKATMNSHEFRSFLGSCEGNASATTQNTCKDPYKWVSHKPGHIYQEAGDLSQCIVTLTACAPGLHCEENQYPVACPSGYYCDKYAGTKTICPKGYYCPRGSKTPKKCGKLSICAEGAKSNSEPFLLIIVIVLVGGQFFLVCFFRKGQSKVSQQPQDSISIKFHSLALKIPTQYKYCGCCIKKKQSQKFRLSGTNGEIKPGNLMCILGASGAGKSTFLNIIAGKLEHTDGTVFINEKEGCLTDFKSRIGFVPQSDVMHPELTVREAITHSAKTRLSARQVSEKSIKDRVEAVLNVLGIQDVAGVIIGDEYRRGISGGQKKRVNIALELVMDPLAILLDEPTSGLDSSTAVGVMKALKTIANGGVTVVSVLHQPRLEIYNQIDTLMLLGYGGKTVYLGQASLAEAHFAKMGYQKDSDDNFADFVLDVLCGRIENDGGQSKSSTITKNVKSQINASRLASNQLSKAFQEMKTETKSDTKLTPENNKTMSDTSKEAPVFFVQLRAFIVQNIRIRFFRTYQLGFDLLAFVFDGFEVPMNIRKIAHRNIFTQICFEPLRNELGPFGFFMTMALGVCAASVSCVSFCGQKKIVFWREASAGVNKLAYFLAVVLVDFPLQCIGAVCFIAPVALIVDVAGPTSSYLQWALCVVWTVSGMGYAVGCAFQTDLSLATLTSVIFAVLINLFGGYVPKAGKFAYWAYSRWSARALTWIEMGIGHESDFPTTVLQKCIDSFNNQNQNTERLREKDGCFMDWDNCGNSDDASCLMSKYDKNAPEEHRKPDFAFDIICLIIFGLLFRIVAYFLLVNVRKDKQR